MKYKPIIRIICLAVSLALLAACGMTEKVEQMWTAKDSNLRKRVTVVPFTSRLDNLKQPAKIIGADVTAEMAKGGSMVVVPYDKVTEEMNKLKATVKDPREQLILACRQLGVSAILTGLLTDLSVTREMTGIYGFRDNDPFLLMELDMRIIDVSNGTILADTAINSQIELTDLQASNFNFGEKIPDKLSDQLAVDLKEPAAKWVQQNVSAMAWTAFVLAVQGDRVQVTVGRDTGLSMGDTVVAYTKGREIRTGSGNIVYLLGRPAGVLRLVEFAPRTAWAVPVPGGEGLPVSGPFEPGQVVLSK